VRYLRIAIYSRKSVFTGKGESIENQIEMCKQYILNNIKNAKEEDILIYEDEGFSAKNMDRPNFQRMIADSKKKPFDYIVCYRLDRISRNVSDFSSLIEDLNERRIAFICIKEQFDTSSPMGRAMMYIASVFSQLERETIAERVRDNMLMLARTGRWLGGTTPTGFMSEKLEEVVVDGKTKTSCKLKFNPDEIEIVKTLFNIFLEVRSISGVSKYLIKNNIKSRTGRYYSLLGIKEILSNPVYCFADKEVREYFIKKDSDVCFDEIQCSNKLGLLSYNKRDYKLKNAPRQDESEWIISIGKHKGIVTGKQWVSIQNTLEDNKPKNKNRIKSNNDYALLSGMIICKKCGSRMFAKIRNNNGREGSFDYICNSKIRGGVNLCNTQNLIGKQTDDLVCNYLLEYMNENSNIYELLEELKNKYNNNDSANQVSKINENINKCKKEIDNYVVALSKSGINDVLIQAVSSKVEELSEKMKVLITEKEKIQEELNKFSDEEIQVDVISRTLSYFKDNFNSLTLYEKREILKLIIDKIEWDGKDLDIFIYGE